MKKTKEVRPKVALVNLAVCFPDGDDLQYSGQAKPALLSYLGDLLKEPHPPKPEEPSDDETAETCHA